VRPDNDKEKYCSKSRTVVRVLDERVVIFDPADTSNAHSKGVPDHFRRSRDQRYIFDRVFDQYSSQAEVYEHTAKVSLAQFTEDHLISRFYMYLFAGA
jgi:kinesin family protein 18/19